jgi:hypothetical protein
MNTNPPRRRGTPPPHGDDRRYRYWNCRCDACREAGRLYSKRHRERRAAHRFTDATATVRRVRALVAAGHCFAVLGQLLNTRPEWPAHLAYGHTGPRGVLTRTDETIRALYEHLIDQPPPHGRAATYARTVARRRGWHPPNAWDDTTIGDPDAQPYDWCADLVDDVAVEMALAGGGTVTLNRAEREQAMRVGLARGLPATVIGRRIGISGSTAKSLAARIRRETEAEAAA